MAIPTLLVALQVRQLARSARGQSQAGQEKHRHLKERQREEGGRANENTHALKEHIAFFFPLPFLFSESSCAFFQHF